MSGDAEARAKVWRHPDVEGRPSARHLLELIAKLIPEGETMTAPLTQPELGNRLGYSARTIREGQAILVEAGALRVVGGGRGARGAVYELLLLEAAGAPPALPLIGRAAPPRRPRPPVDVGHGLFDPRPIDVSERSGGDQGVTNIGSQLPISAQRSEVNFRSWPTRLVAAVKDRISTSELTRWWRKDRKSTSELALPLDVDGTRARDVLLLKESTTTTAPPARVEAAHEPKSNPPPCKYLGVSHAWCGWRVHVPMDLHLEERAKLPRLPGETDADLDAKMFARYAAVAASIPDTQPILAVNGFEFWKPYLRPKPTAVDAGVQRPPGAAGLSRREIEEAQEIRARAYNGCPHTGEPHDYATCVRAIALARRVG